MRKIVSIERIETFLQELGRKADRDGQIYLVGGATAVLFGWRETTIDIDLKMVPETDQLFKTIQELKESLQINVELASPDLFIPPLPGWESRSKFIVTEGKISFYHFDFYSQALSKIERGHSKDLTDVKMMLERDLIETELLLKYFRDIEPFLFRYPALDPASFKDAVESIVKDFNFKE